MGLKQILEHQQKVLELQLAIARERFQHHGLRGASVETAFRAFVEKNLPRSYSVGTGEVIATTGDGEARTSRQLDIVISNDQQPFSADRDEATVLLIEGVSAAGEIKSILNRTDLTKEMEKSSKFKTLRAKNLSRLVSVPKADTWSSYYVHYRPYFIFAFESPSDWRILLLETFDFMLKNNKSPYDAMFLMDKGIVILISPFTEFPFSKFAGIPFAHEITGVGNTLGGVHIYKTTALLAFYLIWLSSVGGTLLGDRSALAHYLEPVVNSSLEDFSLASIKMESAHDFRGEAKVGLEANPLQFAADCLKRALEKQT